MISIIIRAKNEMPWLKYTLAMLKRQTRNDYEVICVDSGSTDGTWELLQDFQPQVLYQIAPEEYIPGKVLNDAINKTKGDIIVFNNADCIPKNELWLENLVHQLEVGSDIIAVYANQLPRPNANPLVEKDYLRAFGDGSIAMQWRHFFSLASSAVKREMIIQYPFNEQLQYSEDIEWSWRMKALGYQIAYVSDAIVEHSHNYSLAQIKKRYLGEGQAEAFIYSDFYRNHPHELNFFRNVILSAGSEIIRDWKYLLAKKRLDWILLAPVYRFAQRYYTFKGRTA